MREPLAADRYPLAVLSFLQPEPNDGTDTSSYYLFYTFLGNDIMSPQFAELTDPLPLSERCAAHLSAHIWTSLLECCHPLTSRPSMSSHLQDYLQDQGLLA